MSKLQHIKTGEIIDLPELIDLQSANATQLTSQGVKGEWSLKKNITGEKLHSFEANVSDTLMQSIIDFGRKFELIAFNKGIKFQKTKQNAILKAQIRELQLINQELGSENERLATLLENLHPEV